jgi:hypothetical protein
VRGGSRGSGLSPGIQQLRAVFAEDELLKMSFDCSRHIPQLRELARRYADRKPGLADLCLVRMSEIYARYTVITIEDGDFRA